MVARGERCPICGASAFPGSVVSSSDLARLVEAVSQWRGFEERLQVAVRLTREFLKADRCSVIIPLGEGVAKVAASSDAVSVGDLLLSLDRYPELVQVWTSSEPVLVEDVSSSKLLAEQLAAIRPTGLMSIAAVPLKFGEASGILRASSKTRSLGGGEVAGLQAVAHVLEHLMRPEEEGTGAWADLARRVAGTVLEVACDGRIVSVSGNLAQELAGSGKKLRGIFLPKLFVSGDRERVRRWLVEALAGADVPQPFSAKLVNGHHAWVWFARDRSGGLKVAISISGAAPGPLPSPAALLDLLPVPAAVVDDEDRLIMANLAMRRIGEGVRRGSAPVHEAWLGSAWLRFYLPPGWEDASMLREAVEEGERQLRLLYSMVEKVDWAHSRFMAWAAHELKTPVSVVLACLEMLSEDASESLGKEQVALLEGALEAAQRLRRVAEGLTELVALDAGDTSLEMEKVDVAELAAAVAGQVAAVAAGWGVRVSVVSAEGPCWARVDRLRLEQVLHNLLDNAVRFSPEGEVVDVAVEGDAGAHKIRISVRDRGPGVPEELMEAIFEPFVRAGRPPRGRPSGSGLGLAIAKRLVEAFGGKIWVENRSPGCEFTVEVPAWPEP